MKNMGKGIGNFISNPNAIRSAMGVPASEQTVDVKATSLGSEPIVKAKAQPKTDLVPNPVKSTAITKKRRGRPKKLQTLAQVQADIDSRNQTYRSPITGGLLPVKKSKKVTSLAKGGMDGDDKKKNVDKALEKDFKIDPKMKKAFSDAMALPAKSAAVALIDLLEKIPAPSKEASKVLNRNIATITNAFKLGAASAEVANDEEDNDSDEEEGDNKIPRWQKILMGIGSKIFGGGKEGEAEGAPSGAPQLPPAVGDPRPGSGRRAPYTGTADGIGLGDGKKGRSMQPIKKRSGMSLAKKALMMTPMGLGFMAGKKLFQGAKGLAGKAAGSGLGKGLKGLAGKAFGLTPMGMAFNASRAMFKGVKNLFAPDRKETNLTELTEATIAENRQMQDEKTEKKVALAKGTESAIPATNAPPTSEQEGSELAIPNIEDSPYLDLYNTTSQF